MPRSQLIDPQEVRQSGRIEIDPIPINRYQSDIDREIEKYGKAHLKKIYYDMLTIREFESMLNAFKTQGSWGEFEYTHQGPAHLSIGQEAATVGQAYHLTPDDWIFGSHRSHGEIIAKCYSAIDKLDEEALERIMESYLDGETLSVVRQKPADSVKELAQDFVLYGTLAEIFGRKAGFTRGLGGSMHAFFPPFGSMPNNAIVGGSADISVGAALFKLINRRPGIVIANIGDAATGCGPTWEAISLASMDQYRQLWPEEFGNPPVLFNFVNNFYGMGGQTAGETMGFKVLARIGAGVNPDNMHAERVDGYNPLAVADAIERKKEVLNEGRGPVLLDTLTYRISGHSPSDASSYRTKEEIQRWEENDCIRLYGNYLMENDVISESEADELQQNITEKMTRVVGLAVSLETSPRLACEDIGKYMFSNSPTDAMEEGREPEVLISQEENPRVQQIARKSRSAFDENGKQLPKMRVLALRDALFEAMLHRFHADPTMVAYGEENRDWGGAFAVYRGLTEALPYHRLFNASISEGAIVGSGVGYALSGGRAVVELMYNDFMGRAGDELFNQASKWQAMSGGLLKMPLVIRVSVGSKYGAQHSQDWTSIVAHIPGLKVMFPATPYDAKGMLNLALRGTDPVVFFESQRIYDIGEMFQEGGVPEEYYEVPEGEPALRREGDDVTVVSIGATLYRAVEAADELKRSYDVDVELFDARFINPLNFEPVLESIRKTGKVVLTSDACERGSFLHTMASQLDTLAFDYLDAPAAVVGSRNWITPAYEMEECFFPQKEWIIDTIHERVLPLDGHRVSTVQTGEELLRRYRGGV